MLITRDQHQELFTVFLFISSGRTGSRIKTNSGKRHRFNFKPWFVFKMRAEWYRKIKVRFIWREGRTTAHVISRKRHLYTGRMTSIWLHPHFDSKGIFNRQKHSDRPHVQHKLDARTIRLPFFFSSFASFDTLLTFRNRKCSSADVSY